MKTVIYIGEPGTGKSTLMREKLADLRATEQDEFVKECGISYHIFREQKTIILGQYEDGVVFCGSDRWSKSAPPKFRQWITDNQEVYNGWTIYGEGERISNNPTLTHLQQETEFNLICLKVSDEELERRRQARNNTQNESWMKGMRTRIVNLCNSFPHQVEVLG